MFHEFEASHSSSETAQLPLVVEKSRVDWGKAICKFVAYLKGGGQAQAWESRIMERSFLSKIDHIWPKFARHHIFKVVVLREFLELRAPKPLRACTNVYLPHVEENATISLVRRLARATAWFYFYFSKKHKLWGTFRLPTLNHKLDSIQWRDYSR